MKTSSKRRVLISSVAMLLVAMLALGTATFAWFTTSTDPYADKFSAKTTKQSTLLLANDTRAGWSTHLEYGVANKTMYPASGNGTAWVMGTSDDSLKGTIDTTTLKSVLPSTADGLNADDYVFVDELNLYNNGTAAVEDVNIDFYMNTANNNGTASYARVALVPIDGTKVSASDLVALGNNVYSTTVKTYQPIINTTGTTGDSITTKNAFHIDVTGTDEVMEAGEKRYYKLYVWFEGQDADCVDANSGQVIPGLRFDISSSIVEE